MAILKESQIIGNYTVQSFIKEGLYNETYRISDKEGVPYFLKIFDPTRIPYDIKDNVPKGYQKNAPTQKSCSYHFG